MSPDFDSATSSFSCAGGGGLCVVVMGEGAEVDFVVRCIGERLLRVKNAIFSTRFSISKYFLLYYVVISMSCTR